MKKVKRFASRLFAMLLVLSMLAGNFVTVYAEGTDAPPDSLAAGEPTPPVQPDAGDGDAAEPTAPPPDDSVPPIGDASSSSIPATTASSDASLPAISSSTPPQEDADESSTSLAPEEAFLPLKIAEFTAAPQGFAGAPVELSVALNRDDVAVTYQWQTNKPTAEEPLGLLHDYTDDLETSYYFPYFDITEAELLAMNPDATWPGIEMYLAALEEAGGDVSAVDIENGAPNTVVEGAEAETENTETTPEAAALALEAAWTNIEGATDSAYTFTLDEENALGTYRCVITIVDEAYLAQAAAHVEDAYGPHAAPENSAPVADPASASAAATSTVQDDAPETIALLPVATLFSDVASVTMLSIMPMAAPNTIDFVQQSGPWMIGLDTKMEYLTADTLAANPDAANAGNLLWTNLGSNGLRPDGSKYLHAGLTYDGKLPILSAWYGKTVYFRYKGDAIGAAKAIDIPAYTGFDYTTGMKTLYKDAVSVLNVRVPETARDFYDYFVSGIRNQDSGLIGAEGTSIKTTTVPLTPFGGIYAGSSFNENAAAFLKDAEGNYRYDSVMVGVNVGQEPDISGAAAWALRAYIEEGYGFITGHDMMYGYGGVNPSPNYVPDSNSTTTPYYRYNTRIDGHWNMNWLMGTNKHYTDASPYEAASMVLCVGDYRDKTTLYGEHDNDLYSTIRIKTHTGSPERVSNRTPTNYPYNVTYDGGGYAPRG